MKKIFKKVLVSASSIMIASSMFLTSNAGINAQELSMTGAMENYTAEDQFKATEPVTFSFLYRDHPNYPLNTEWLFFTKLEEMTNVKLDLTIAPMSDYEQRRSLLISAGDAPMIIGNTYAGMETPFVSSGAILPISDYLDYLPHFTKRIEEWGLQEEIDALRQLDGKFYILPGLHESIKHDYTLALRTDILEELGLEEPKTWEEVHQTLTKIKEAYPDSYPLSDRFKGNSLLNYMASSYETVAGWGFGQGVVFNKEEDKFEYAPTTQNYRDMLQVLSSMMKDGLIDPESFTQEDDQAIQKLANEKSFAISTNSQNLFEYRSALDATVGEGNYEIKKIMNPSSPYGDQVGGTRLENGIMISAKAVESPNFVALLQFVDWLYYSDEGQEFARWGVEGVTYNKDENGKRTLSENVDWAGLNPKGEEQLNADYGFSNGVFTYGGKAELIQSVMVEEEIEFQKLMNENKTLPDIAPAWPLEESVREQFTLLATPLKDATDQATLQFILGNRSLEDYEMFIEELKGLGLDQYMEMVNTAYQNAKNVE
ncbi:sugar ABC transporter substrate-binding protein [Globicatella sp. HMSC072A10]|uniref:ABC transporter substrate-binding protein n=1 Tax=Globicatella sp. HMSC072A10 TaxID=1739315 RepID=UPI0008B62A3F|nr:extracellular solute-binding protein [Globicatella sp. HMSC072A10]OFK56509.1 sugar ABC transporter substrate-binding protein [Globicatella sp. HMSC072A10]